MITHVQQKNLYAFIFHAIHTHTHAHTHVDFVTGNINGNAVGHTSSINSNNDAQINDNETNST